MGGRSRLFLIAALVLIVLNGGLVWAVVQQRDQAAFDRNSAQLNAQLSQLKQRLSVAQEVERTLPGLKAKNAALQSQFRSFEQRLYKPEDQPIIEAALSRMATSPRGRGPGMQVDRIVTRITDETPPFKEHTFSVYLRGKTTLLPTYSEEFFSDPMLSLISRFAAISPDMQFRDMDMVVRAHFYEANLSENPGPSARDILAPFTELTATPAGAESDPRLQTLQAEIKTTREALEKLHPALIETAGLEANILQLESLHSRYRDLSAERERNRDLANENLPKLYLRVRNSPLGGAALDIDDTKVTFPDFAGDD